MHTIAVRQKEENDNEQGNTFLNPVFTHNIWGGTKLREEYGYDVEGDDIGECWGVAAHENGNCTVKMASLQVRRLPTYGTATESCLAV